MSRHRRPLRARRAPARRRLRPRDRRGRIVVVAALVLAAVGIVASDPAARVKGFKALPGADIASSDGGFVKAHLLSGGGSGRWQFWSAALDQWDAHRVLGDGAGTYESWWAQHASFSYFVRDAHSLYLEALGELGIVGFLLIVAVVVSGSRRRGCSGPGGCPATRESRPRRSRPCSWRTDSAWVSSGCGS